MRCGAGWLERDNFRCIASNGRVAVVSLETLDSEFSGSGSANGGTAAQRLLQQGEIERRMVLYWAFSKLIANSDMHQGNLLFLRPEQHPVAMAFAPSGNGNMRREAVAIRLSHEVSGTIWRQAELLALEFWRRTAFCPQISYEFRTIAAQMLA